jgi:hypothetical protein
MAKMEKKGKAAIGKHYKIASRTVSHWLNYIGIPHTSVFENGNHIPVIDTDEVDKYWIERELEKVNKRLSLTDKGGR